MKTINVDLKWFLWTADRVIWDDYAPDAINAMRRAFDGRPDCFGLKVILAPRKEIQFGSVEIVGDKIKVFLWTEWDDTHELMCEHYIENDVKFEQLCEGVDEYLMGHVYGMPLDKIFDTSDSNIGAWVYKEFKAKSFQEFLEITEALNDELLHLENKNSKLFHKVFDKG